MGCLLSLLTLLLFPIFYAWLSFQRMRNGGGGNFWGAGRQPGSDTAHNNSNNAYGTAGQERQNSTESSLSKSYVKKPHVFQRGEGEYVEFSEID